MQRIEAVVATAIDDALANVRHDLAARPADTASLQTMIRRLDALEALPSALTRSLTESVAACIDQRLDAVDDHLADLTRTLTQHPAWNMEDGFSRVHGELAALGDAVRDGAGSQITDQLVRDILNEAMQEAPQPNWADLEASISKPILAALDAAVATIMAQQAALTNAGPGPGADLGADDAVARAAVADSAFADAAFVESMRQELATTRAGQSEDIQKVETRLGLLQDSVVALTEQMRISREASERADLAAHANAMTFAMPHGSAFDPVDASRNGARTPEPVRPGALPGLGAPAQGAPGHDLASAPPLGLPRAGQLASADASPAEVKSRFIAAARRANAGARDQTRGPAAPNPVARRGASAGGKAGVKTRHKALTRWLRGKGLLWAAAVVVIAGAMPLLAPALRALPDALLQPAGDSAQRSQTNRAPEKIGSQLAAATMHPASIVDDPAALYALGDRIAEGSSVGSPRLAASLLEKAAERGQAPAQYRIARLYEKGAGIGKDIRRAETWYTRAADQGNIRAMHNLAVLHAEGSLGNVDYAMAAQWFRKAAERGLADSQYNLGVLLARGLGGAANPGEAWVWFDIGARNGDKEAAARRDEIGATLTPDALAAARTAAANWRRTPGNALANDPPAAGATQPTGVTAGTDRTRSGLPV